MNQQPGMVLRLVRCTGCVAIFHLQAFCSLTSCSWFRSLDVGLILIFERGEGDDGAAVLYFLLRSQARVCATLEIGTPFPYSEDTCQDAKRHE
jgi:hypothetical protein